MAHRLPGLNFIPWVRRFVSAGAYDSICFPTSPCSIYSPMNMKNFPKLNYWLWMRPLLFHCQWWSLYLAHIWFSFHRLSMGKSSLNSYVWETIFTLFPVPSLPLFRQSCLIIFFIIWDHRESNEQFFNLQAMKVLVGLCLWSFYSNWKSKARCLLVALYLVC